MNEIDFEELDRAVNSLNAQPQAVSITPTPQVAETKSSVQSTPMSGVQSPQAVTPAPPIAPRPSTGRFMDMVHPSADMRTAVAPRETVSTPPVVQAPTSSTDVEASAPEAVSSPFLPDAQVEKRPLGAFTTPLQSATIDKPTVEPSYEAIVPDQEPVEAEVSEQAEIESALLPPELHTDLLDIESNEDAVEEITPSVDMVSPEPVVESVSKPAPAVSDPVATFGGSIPQQYTEKPAEQPIETHTAPVFDAHAFSQPPKKKNGWLVVLWITLLILLGAGAGAAIYFYVLPLL